MGEEIELEPDNRYSFCLSEASRISITLYTDYKYAHQYYDYYFCSIYRVDAYTGEEERITVIDAGDSTLTISLPAGYYYLSVWGGELKGIVEINPVNTAIEEMEENDTFDTAQNIDLDIMFRGASDKGLDEDYFRFNLETQGTLFFEVFDAMYLNDVRLYYEDEDLNVEEIIHISNKNIDGYIKSKQYRLPAGVYYIRFSGQSYVDGIGKEYRFKVNYTEESPEEFETEAYDLKEDEHLVNTIETNQTYTGNLQTSTDVDYYSFEVADSSRVQLKFTQPRGTTAGTFQVRLFQKDEDGKETNIEKLTTETNPVYYMEQIVLEAGTYYAEVKYGEKGSYSDEISFVNYKLLINEDPVVLVNNIKLSTSTKEFYVGESFTLKATITPEDAEDTSVTWSSSDSTVAKVNKKGKVSCISVGSCYIYAKANDGSGKKATFKLEVKENLVKEIKITSSKKTVYSGWKCKLTATVTPSNASNTSVTWMSSDPSIAKVDANGNVTCVAPGTCYISATANDGSDVSTDYKLRVYKNTNKTIKNLNISAGTLDKTFQSSVTDYVITLPKNTSKVTIKWARSTTTSFVTVNGKESTKSATKTTVSVSPGKSKVVEILVTAQNGDTQTYTFTVTREK